MQKISSFNALEKLGRVRLSKHFYMRDFLYSEIANYYKIPNIPDDPDMAIAAGEKLCQELLDPLFETFGNVIVRSAFRSCAVNQYGNENKLNCSSNERTYADHIWDRRDSEGRMGACACIVIPWFADQYGADPYKPGRDWRDLAWWIHDNLPYSSMYFFPVRAAVNLVWREDPAQSIKSYIPPLKDKRYDYRKGTLPDEGEETRKQRYKDFPAFRGIPYPPTP